jgi:hypothetical protein
MTKSVRIAKILPSAVFQLARRTRSQQLAQNQTQVETLRHGPVAASECSPALADGSAASHPSRSSGRSCVRSTRRATVVALIRHQFFDPLQMHLRFILRPRLGPSSDLFCYLFTGLAQGFIQRRRIALSAACSVTATMAPVSRSTACSALYAKMCPPIRHLCYPRVPVRRTLPFLFEVRFLRFRSNRTRSSRVGVLIPDAFANPHKNSSYVSPVSRRTIDRIAAFASNVESGRMSYWRVQGSMSWWKDCVPVSITHDCASMPIRCPFSSPRSANNPSTHANPSRCLAMSIKRRVREIVE